MKFPIAFALSLLLLSPGHGLAQVSQPDTPGSLNMDIQLENIFVHRHEPVVHALVNLRADQSSGGHDLPVNLSLVIDRSGSMQGQKIADARQAALSMVDRLRAGDRVSIVSYSDGARVDVRSTVINDRTRRRIQAAIRRISTSGSTHLSGGLEAGIREVKRHVKEGQANRVLLISDGLANRGITSVSELNRIARAASQDGVVTTTLGLGEDYNEDLMTAVANHGAGNYYFVEHSEDLAGTLDSELDQMMATIAGGASLELHLGDDITVEEVYGYAWKRTGGRTVIQLGDVFAGQRRAVLVKLRLPRRTSTFNVGEFALLYEDLADRSGRQSAAAELTVTVTGDRSKVRANRNLEVEARIGEIELATKMQEAARMVEEGRYERAREVLQDARGEAKLKARSLGASGDALGASADETEELMERLKRAPASATERKALIKRSKGKAYKLRKK